MTESLLDRSVIFSVLLDISPEFGALTSREGSEVVTRVVEAWRKKTEPISLYDFTQQWLAEHPLQKGTTR